MLAQARIGERVLILSDCQGALQAIEGVWREGRFETTCRRGQPEEVTGLGGAGEQVVLCSASRARWLGPRRVAELCVLHG